MKKNITILIIVFSYISIVNAFSDEPLSKTVRSQFSTKKTDQTSKFIDCKIQDNDIQEINKDPGLAYFRMALCRFDSINNITSFDNVIQLLKKSAANNYPPSYFALGVFYREKYEHGSEFYGAKGEPDDILQAIKYFKLAAKLGVVSAENFLGEIYLNEANISSDLKNNNFDVKSGDSPINIPNIHEAILWLQLASEHGQPAAQGTLADLYNQGIGIPQNYLMAYVWSTLSVASQYQFNQHATDTVFGDVMKVEKYDRDKIYQQLTETQKDEANNILSIYKEKYIIKPSALDSYCQNLQSIICLRNAEILINAATKSLDK